LQEKCYEPVGDPRTRSADVRILAATNRDLEAAVAAGRFREDLLYRLNVIELTVPPLRQRPADILPLAEHLLRFFARQTGKASASFTDAARAALQRHPWPGNVRELRNVLERAVILAPDSEIGAGDLPAQLSSPPRSGVEVGGRVTLEELESEHIRRVLAFAATIEEASEVLGIDPSTLYRKRKRYGL
jgi:NtrC-family two-component system response regulator AlgB